MTRYDDTGTAGDFLYASGEYILQRIRKIGSMYIPAG